MARRRKAGGIKIKARKKVTVKLLEREHAGKVTTPYRLLEETVREHHHHLIEAKIAVAWRLGKKADADGRIWLGQAKKGSDLDRSLHGFDFVILLNHEVWNGSGFTEDMMRALVDHELCHCAVANDSNGEPKTDEEGRTVWRIRKHDLEEFKEIVARHGQWKDDIRAFVDAALRDKREAEAQPLLKHPAADRPAPVHRNWRDVPLEEIGFSNVIESAMREAGLETLGAISDHSEANKGLNGIPNIGSGRAGNAAEILSEFWAKHPELVESQSTGEHEAGHVLPMGATG